MGNNDSLGLWDRLLDLGTLAGQGFILSEFPELSQVNNNQATSGDPGTVNAVKPQGFIDMYGDYIFYGVLAIAGIIVVKEVL